MIDSLALILNPSDEVGLEYTKKFAKMKDSQIYTTSKIPDTLQESSDNNAIDYIVSRIVSYYRENLEKYNSFKALFSSKDHMDSKYKYFMMRCVIISQTKNLTIKLLINLKS